MIELRLKIDSHHEQDFSELYKFLTNKYTSKDKCPGILLLDDVEPQSYIDSEGNVCVFLDRNSPDLLRDLKNIIRKQETRIDYTTVNQLSSLWNPEVDYAIWYKWLLEICEYLNIEVPAVFFTRNMNNQFGDLRGAAFPENKPYVTDIFILVDYDFEYALKTMIHELRHVWQHKNHNDWFDGYFTYSKQNENDYYFQMAEIEADAFAYWVMETNGVGFILEDLGEERSTILRENMAILQEKEPVLKLSKY